MGDTTIDTTQQQTYETQQQSPVDNPINDQVTGPVDESVNSEPVNDKSHESGQNNSKKEEQFDYNIFIKSLNDSGLDTTHLNANETNFLEYGAYLSEEVQNMIKDSFDCEQDYILQQEVARLFAGQGNSVWQTNTFIHQLYAMGYTVDVQTIATQYLTDWKKGGSSYLRTDGAINVLTISDGKGGEIVIADANGNGAIECEELFMNQILEGINSDFIEGVLSPVPYLASKVASEGGIKGAFNYLYDKTLDLGAKLSMLTKKKLSQSQYNQLVDNYIARHHCLNVGEAVAQINARYNCNTNDIKYSGKYEGQKYTADLDAITGAALDTEAQNEAVRVSYNKDNNIERNEM